MDLDVRGPLSVETRADLARELTALRARQGLSVRELARRTKTPVATVGDYFSGKHLPGPAQLGLYRSLLAECGIGEAEQDLWVGALLRARVTSDARASKAPPPYLGLDPFQEADSGLFFGREEATEELIARIVGALQRGRDKIALVGASGSGKSSLLRAGLVPAVRRGALNQDGTPWGCAVMTPGRHPADALAEALVGVGEGRRLLVLDQFEEALGPEVVPEARAALLDALDHLGEGTFVVIALRADFYEAAAREPVLLSVLREDQVLLGPMTEAQVRRAILEPAREAGVAVEEALVDLVLADLAPGRPTGFAHDVGALPLLSYSLMAAWEHAQRNQLTVADYRAVGGLRGAVSQSAEALYNELSPAERDLARRIFLRLVTVREDVPTTKRLASRQELEDLGATPGGAPAGELLGRFVTARLVTAGPATFEVSHEALLSAWPRLAAWTGEDREGLYLHRQLTEGANQWLAAGQDPSMLFRGTRLERTTEWATDAGHQTMLNRAEQQFVRACLAQADAERRAGRRGARRMKGLLITVASLAVAASVLAGVALRANAKANRAKDAAVQAKEQALSRQVAIEAQQVRASDPSLATQLALAAYRTYPTVQARSTLIDTSASEMPTRLLGPDGPDFLSFSRDGSLLAVAESSGDIVQLYTVGDASPRRVAKLPGGPAGSLDFAVALSPNGRRLAIAGTNSAITLWDLADPAHPVREALLRGFESTVYAVAFSPNGKLLAGASNDGTVRQWLLGAGTKPVADGVAKIPGAPPMKAVAYSPDGTFLAAVGGNGTLATWPAGRDGPVEIHREGTSTLETVAFSPGGKLLVTAGDDHLVRVLRVTKAGLQADGPPMAGPASYIYSVAFSPNGKLLAAGGEGVKVWRAATLAPLESFNLANPVTSLAFMPGRPELATADSSGTTRLWRLPSPATYQAPGSVEFLQYFDHGRYLAATSGGPQGDVEFWHVAGASSPAPAGSVSMPAGLGPVAGVSSVSPSGRLLAAGNAAGEVQLFDISRLGHPVPLGGPFKVATTTIEQLRFSPSGRVFGSADDLGEVRLWAVGNAGRPRSVALLGHMGGKVLGFSFSPDGNLLAAAVSTGRVWIWDVASPAHAEHLATVGGFNGYAYDTAFSPDGKTLVACSSDGTIRLWDISRPSQPRLLGKPLSGPRSYVVSVRVSPHGNFVAASGLDDTVWVWDIADRSHPRLFAALSAEQGGALAVSFSPQGRVLAGSGLDQTLHFWDYHPTQVVSLICAVAGDPITRSEWSEYLPGERYRPICRGGK